MVTATKTNTNNNNMSVNISLPSSPSSGVNTSGNKLSVGSAAGSTQATERRRRSSSLIGHLEPETVEEETDQSSLPNLNATWVNYKGAWVVHIFIVLLLLLLFDLIPGVSRQIAWTLTNATYVIGTYIMFHYVKGIPFEFNAGAYDTLTMWEQIDGGDQYTPAKKFLLGVPVGLFLISTHYTNYDLTFFIINCCFCVISVVPKLPSSHKLRFMPGDGQM